MSTTDESIARLLQVFRPGERVRAAKTIIFGTGEEVPEGTCGHVQQTNVNGCMPLVTVAWDGMLHILHAVSVENLDSLEPS